jgi:uracil-DNA glycosylase
MVAQSMTAACEEKTAEYLVGVHKEWLEQVFEKCANWQDVTKFLDALTSAQRAELRPKLCDVFKFAQVCKSPADVFAIVIGQDPYPKQGDAHGLAFSTCAKTMPASLKEISRCLATRTPKVALKNENLEHWCAQGFLLLNASLTYMKSMSTDDAAKLWQPFVLDVIRGIIAVQRKYPVLIMAWGNYAKAVAAKINAATDAWKLLACHHPSPLANARLSADKKFAAVCDHFEIADAVYTQITGKKFGWTAMTI